MHYFLDVQSIFEHIRHWAVSQFWRCRIKAISVNA